MALHDVRARIAFAPRFTPQLLHRDDRTKVVLVCLDAGQGIPPHAEDNQAFFFVVEGRGAVITDRGPVAVEAGELVDVPRGGVRGLQAQGDRMVVLATAVLGAPVETSPAGPIERELTADHQRLERLLDRSVADPERFDHAAFEAFRAGLLRHIGIEEKILLPDAKRRRGSPLPVARALRVEHGAIASLLVPTPDAALVGELRALLAKHDGLEEGDGGLYAACEALAGDEVDELLVRVRAAPEVPLAAHFDGHGVHRTARDALAAAERALASRDPAP